jgi:hypothetical protein
LEALAIGLKPIFLLLVYKYFVSLSVIYNAP